MGLKNGAASASEGRVYQRFREEFQRRVRELLIRRRLPVAYVERQAWRHGLEPAERRTLNVKKWNCRPPYQPTAANLRISLALLEAVEKELAAHPWRESWPQGVARLRRRLAQARRAWGLPEGELEEVSRRLYVKPELLELLLTAAAGYPEGMSCDRMLCPWETLRRLNQALPPAAAAETAPAAADRWGRADAVPVFITALQRRSYVADLRSPCSRCGAPASNLTIDLPDYFGDRERRCRICSHNDYAWEGMR